MPPNSKRIRPLAVSSPYRLPSLPNVPTFKEAGVPGVELTGRLGIYGPPRTPDDARATLGSAIAAIVKQPDMREKFRAIGFEPTGLGVKEFSEHHAAEVKRWVAFMTRSACGSRRALPSHHRVWSIALFGAL
jgi:tripartite-type tricarboxylate transporter receptor subunit TctC